MTEEEKKEHKKKLKSENNKRYYAKHKEKNIARVREWEKENYEKRKEYTKKYYQTERGKAMKAGQRKRRLEKVHKLKEENQQLKDLIENFENWLIEEYSKTDQESYLKAQNKLSELKKEFENEKQ